MWPQVSDQPIDGLHSWEPARRGRPGKTQRVLAALARFLTALDWRYASGGSWSLVSWRARIRGGRHVTIGTQVRIHAGAEIDATRGTVSLGDRCIIHSGAKILTFGGHITLGRNCSVNPYCVLYGHGGLRIGDNVRIAAGCILIPANHLYNRTDQPIHHQGEQRLGITVGNDVWIGCHACILDGVTIREGAVIAAGAVVNRDVDAYTVVGGVPAHPLKKRGT
jgi:acetyltransferase-like isoleucine patch superfamily enzyme